MQRTWLTDWNPEDELFWQRQGKAIARRNLAFSIFAEFLGFSVWQLWSVVAVKLSSAGFSFSVPQLFLLASLPGLVGATVRFPYTLAVPKFGGRNWTVVSVLLLLLPTLSLVWLTQHPSTPFWAFAAGAALAGLGGGNFASSMANISFFYPDKHKGFALGLNAGGGNIGVSVVQFSVPLVITVGLFGVLGGPAQTLLTSGEAAGQVWLQNAGLMWLPLIALAAVCAWLFMDNLSVARGSLREQASILKNKHTYLLSLLYIGTFGSFIGFSGALPLLIKTQFPDVNPLQFAFLGPLIGSLIRPLGGWLSDRFGGARVTFGNFVLMILAVSSVIFFLNAGSFVGFLLMFLVLFAATGIGNGSTFRMIPSVFRNDNLRTAAQTPAGQADALKNAAKQTATALGFTSAVGAYGAFFVPNSYSASIAASGGVQPALYSFVGFYAVCLAITALAYLRPARSSTAAAEPAHLAFATSEPAEDVA